jgi:hypothetical protein
VTTDVTGMNKYLSNRINGYQGIWVEVMEGARNLCRRMRRDSHVDIHICDL